MWLQPPFFSMVLWHFGQSCVFALSQLAVSLSSRHFFSHLFTTLHGAGACISGCRHDEQNVWPLPHVTNVGSTSGAARDDPDVDASAALREPPPPGDAIDTSWQQRPQLGLGHHTTLLARSTNESARNERYLPLTSLSQCASTKLGPTFRRHPSCGQPTSVSPSFTFIVRYVAQHVSQKRCPQAKLLAASGATSRQIAHSKSRGTETCSLSPHTAEGEFAPAPAPAAAALAAAAAAASSCSPEGIREAW
mmetsp:Transcript_13965/g.34945  ORF Transcript_13965/g.34945 Transcript_13965/m.34945 type:complete len:249 (+) Transcript_13965:822-1568(+)